MMASTIQCANGCQNRRSGWRGIRTGKQKVNSTRMDHSIKWRIAKSFLVNDLLFYLNRKTLFHGGEKRISSIVLTWKRYCSWIPLPSYHFLFCFFPLVGPCILIQRQGHYFYSLFFTHSSTWHHPTCCLFLLAHLSCFLFLLAHNHAFEQKKRWR